MNQEAFESLVQNVAWLLALGVVYEALPAHAGRHRRAAELLAGLVIGAVGIAVMSRPWQFSPGVVFDTRSILLGLTGLFFGAVPALLAAAMTGLYRWVGGGAGVWAGLGAIAIATGLGLAWRRLRGLPPRRSPSVQELLAFGFVLHAAVLLSMLTLPGGSGFEVVSAIWVPLLVAYPVGTVLLGGLLARQQARRGALHALEESEARHRSLFESNRVPMLLIDPDSGAIIDANPAASEWYGWSREELSAKRIFEINTLSPERVREEMCRASAKEQNRFLFQHRRAEGPPREVEVYSVAIRDAGRGLLYSIVIDVTERRRAEAALIEERGRFRQILDSFPSAVCIVEDGHRLGFVNRVFERAFGRAEGRTCHDHLAARAEPCPGCQGDRVRGGEPSQWEWSSPANGRLYEVHGIPLRDVDGTVSLLEVFDDVTERRFGERALAESEARFRATFEQAAVGRVLTLPDGRIDGVNATFCRILGRAEQEVTGRHFSEFTHPEDQEASRRIVEDLLAGESDSGRFEKRYLHADGRAVWCDVSVVLLRDAGGRPGHFITDVIDVSERREAREGLRRQGELLRGILDNIPLMVSFLEPDGRHRWVNRTWEETLGWTLDEVRERSVVRELFPDPTVRARIREVILGREALREEFRVRTRDGADRLIAWVNVPLSDGTSLGIGEDVTDTRAAELKRRGLEAQLVESQKMEAVGLLAGGIAHDFNNLLSIILGYGELLLVGLEPGDPNRESVEEIQQAGIRARDLTRQLLAYGRRQVLEMCTVDVNEVVRALERLLRRVIGEEVELRLRLAPGVCVQADSSQLEQVLMNLAVNARDAMPGGGTLTLETARVEPDGESPEPRVLITVADTGVGMDSGTLARIFEPFFSTKEKEKGSGLGLATAFGIVRQHGGRIAASSEPGKGATFRVWLPASKSGPVAVEAGPEEPPAPSSGVTVLVVEDDPRLRQMVGGMLVSNGYRVLEADGGAQALALAAAHPEPIGLLLSDVVMPGMRGPEIFRRLGESHPETRGLFMSGYPEDALSRDGVLVAGVRVIEKPFTVPELLRKIGAVLAD